MEYLKKDGTKEEFITILEDPKKADVFQHFKGKKYKILTLGKDSETTEDVIIYKGEYGNNPIWVRTAEDFFSKIDKQKYKDINQQYRFEKLN